MQFRLGEVEDGKACRPGWEKALAAFEPNESYSLDDIAASGLSESEVYWLAAYKAEGDALALARIRRWAKACGADQLGGTVAECFREVHKAMAGRVASRVAAGMARAAAKAEVRAGNFQRLLAAFRD